MCLISTILCRLIEKDLPLNVSDIKGDYLREHIEKNGCCGATELLKLYAWSFTEYHRVVHLDMDSLVLDSMDELYGLDKDLLYTCDYGMMTKGSAACPVQGGFLVVRPSLKLFTELIDIVLEGDFRDGGAWGGTRIGWFWGGMTIQGEWHSHCTVYSYMCARFEVGTSPLTPQAMHAMYLIPCVCALNRLGGVLIGGACGCNVRVVWCRAAAVLLPEPQGPQLSTGGGPLHVQQHVRQRGLSQPEHAAGEERALHRVPEALGLPRARQERALQRLPRQVAPAERGGTHALDCRPGGAGWAKQVRLEAFKPLHSDSSLVCLCLCLWMQLEQAATGAFEVSCDKQHNYHPMAYLQDQAPPPEGAAYQ
jgi:hypothetical protein